jgi:exodeoxyribonuclease VII small subunit
MHASSGSGSRSRMARPDPKTERPESAESALSFEQALERLETIVEELERGSLTLEQSIARYEEGVRLSRRLTQTLDEAEKRIERLMALDDGRLETQPFDLDAADAADAEPAPPAPPPAPRREPRPTPSPRASRGDDPPGGDDELPF